MKVRYAGLLVLLAVAFAAQPADALAPPVEMQDFRFVPKTYTKAHTQDVAWHNDGSVQHSVQTRNSAPGSFSLSLAPTFTSASTAFFDSVGKYPYFCTFHPSRMRGTIDVRVTADSPSKALNDPFTLTFAADPGGIANYDLQVKYPNADRYVTLVRDTASTTFVFAPSRLGTYRVRGRTQRYSGESTGYSSPTKITVT
jgi:plastocyanin